MILRPARCSTAAMGVASHGHGPTDLEYRPSAPANAGRSWTFCSCLRNRWSLTAEVTATPPHIGPPLPTTAPMITGLWPTCQRSHDPASGCGGTAGPLSSSAPIVRLAATDRYNQPFRRRYTRRSARLFCLVAGTGAKGVGLAMPKWIFVRRWLAEEAVRRGHGRREVQHSNPVSKAP
jgi:hypothetical protein